MIMEGLGLLFVTLIIWNEDHKPVPILDLNCKLELEKLNEVSEYEWGRSSDLLHIVLLCLPALISILSKLDKSVSTGQSGECSEFTAGARAQAAAAIMPHLKIWERPKAVGGWWLSSQCKCFSQNQPAVGVDAARASQSCTVCWCPVTPPLPPASSQSTYFCFVCFFARSLACLLACTFLPVCFFLFLFFSLFIYLLTPAMSLFLLHHFNEPTLHPSTPWESKEKYINSAKKKQASKRKNEDIEEGSDDIG